MKHKIAITVLFILGLLLLIFLFALGLVILFANDILWTGGVLSLLAFFIVAIVFGYTMERVVDRIKRLWL